MSQITSVLSAMGQGTRLDILRLLSNAPDEGMTSGSLAVELDVPLNSMSTHLAVLLRAGLVRAERSGRNVFYRALQDRVQETLAPLSILLPDQRPSGQDRFYGNGLLTGPAMERVLARTVMLTSINVAAARRWSEMSPPRMDEVSASLRRISDLSTRAVEIEQSLIATEFPLASHREAGQGGVIQLAR